MENKEISSVVRQISELEFTDKLFVSDLQNGRYVITLKTEYRDLNSKYVDKQVTQMNLDSESLRDLMQYLSTEYYEGNL